MEISFHRQANRLPPTYFAKRLIQQGGAGGFACRSNGHNQWSGSNEQIPKTIMYPRLTCLTSRPFLHEKCGVRNVCRKNLGPMAWTVRAPLPHLPNRDRRTPPPVSGVDPIGEAIGGQTIDHVNINTDCARPKKMISRTPPADCPPSIASGPPRRTAAEN